MKNIFILVLFLFGFHSSQSQNCDFYFVKVDGSTVDVYIDNLAATENVIYYDIAIYYNSAETSYLSHDVTPTNTNLGWNTAGNVTFSNISQTNPNVPITHDMRVQIGVLDGNFVGSMITEAKKIATFTFDNSPGTADNGGDIYFGTTADTDLGILYYGSDFGGHDIIVSGNLSIVLPIKLLDFSAVKWGERNAKLDWSTSIEKNASHFILERNIKGGGLWANAGRVNAVGESNIPQYYSFIDNDIFKNYAKNNIVLYRLKMVDKDGSFEYSSIKTLIFKGEGTEITVYPNPTSDYINIEWNGNNALGHEKGDLEIYDVSGKLMLKKQIARNEINQEDITAFPAGSYRIFVKYKGGVYFNSFIKMD